MFKDFSQKSDLSERHIPVCLTPRVPPPPPPLWKVIGTCRWTGYVFAGHQYWHRVSNRPNVVITIITGYQNRPSFITGSRAHSVLWQGRDPGGGDDLFFLGGGGACQLSIANETGYIRGVQYCNRVCIWMFWIRYIMTGCLFRAPSAIWQGQVLTPQRHPLSSWEVECPPLPPPPGGITDMHLRWSVLCRRRASRGQGQTIDITRPRPRTPRGGQGRGQGRSSEDKAKDKAGLASWAQIAPQI